MAKANRTRDSKELKGTQRDSKGLKGLGGRFLPCKQWCRIDVLHEDSFILLVCLDNQLWCLPSEPPTKCQRVAPLCCLLMAGYRSSPYPYIGPYIIYHHLPVLTPCSSASRPFSSCCFLSLSISFISGYPKTEHKRRAVVCLQTMACRAMLLQPFASASVALLRRHGACLGTNAECVRTNLH